ncbi:type VI secretion system baseplate subunit TssG [Massilia sp. CMS3.1]|uniref:type VI secretion system baseplate subunit TssG n=1 Tax=Massilia sp. CMS3.1 TaxID=3373083 RepID=UPI003EE5E423
MRPTHRRETASVIERLLAAPHEFEFVQAVSVLLASLMAQGASADEALHHNLRFENSLLLGFPASEIEAIARAERADDAAAPGAGGGHRFTITPTFMGLLGAQGTLPRHVTERIAAWQSARDDAAPRAFLDLLSNRMLALFYRAWQKSRVEYMPGQKGDGEDRLRPLLLALSGCAPGQAGHAPPESLAAHYAGMLGQRPSSSVVLERIVSDFFGVAVRIEEAVGHWDRLLPHEQAQLGINAELGENVLLGERSWRPDLRARLRIGPLDAAGFAQFLPSGEASAALRAILRRFAEPTVGFEVELVLRAQDVRPMQLAGPATGPGLLGRDSFLIGGPAGADRADMRYLMLPMAPLGALSATGSM